MTTSNFTASYQTSLPTHRELRRMGNKIVVGTVVKANMGDLEEEVREVCLRRTRKELTVLVQINIVEEDFIFKVLESTHHRDSREDSGGEGT